MDRLFVLSWRSANGSNDTGEFELISFRFVFKLESVVGGEKASVPLCVWLDSLFVVSITNGLSSNRCEDADNFISVEIPNGSVFNWDEFVSVDMPNASTADDVSNGLVE